MSCTYRLEKAIQRLEGVEKVRVQVQPPHAEVTPKAGAWIDAARLRGAVKNSGFKPGEIRYTLTGTLTLAEGRPVLRLDGRDRVFVLEATPAAPQEFAQAAHLAAEGEARVEIEGILPDAGAPSSRQPQLLRVQRVRRNPPPHP